MLFLTLFLCNAAPVAPFLEDALVFIEKPATPVVSTTLSWPCNSTRGRSWVSVALEATSVPPEIEETARTALPIFPFRPAAVLHLVPVAADTKTKITTTAVPICHRVAAPSERLPILAVFARHGGRATAVVYPQNVCGPCGKQSRA